MDATVLKESVLLTFIPMVHNYLGGNLPSTGRLDLLPFPQDDTAFEKQSALFALAIADIVLINM